MNNLKSLASVQNKTKQKTQNCTANIIKLIVVIVVKFWLNEPRSKLLENKNSLRFLILTSLLVVIQPNLIPDPPSKK